MSASLLGYLHSSLLLFLVLNFASDNILKHMFMRSKSSEMFALHLLTNYLLTVHLTFELLLNCRENERSKGLSTWNNYLEVNRAPLNTRSSRKKKWGKSHKHTNKIFIFHHVRDSLTGSSPPIRNIRYCWTILYKFFTLPQLEPRFQNKLTNNGIQNIHLVERCYHFVIWKWPL